MRRIFITAISLVIGVVATMAQPKAGTFSIIPRLGVAISKVTGDKVYTNLASAYGDATHSNYKPGLMAGVDFEYQFSDMLAASIGAYYSRQGERFDDVKEAHDMSTKQWNEVRDWKQHHDYVNVPLIASAYVADNLALKVGVQVGFNVDGKMEYTEASFVRDQAGVGSTESVKKIKGDVKLKKVDFAIPVGISYEYMNVILDARYNIGLTKVYDNIDGKNSVFTFSAGYRFSL